jgi:signal peptidase II
MNLSLFLFFNALRSPAIDDWMNLGTRLGNFWNMPWILLGLGLVYACSRLRGNAAGTVANARLGRLMAALLLGYVLAGLAVAGLKFGLHLPRPSVVLGPQVMFSHEMPDSPYSFPSGHSAFAMLLTATFWPRAGRIAKLFLMAYVLWVGVSRVNLGMHFPVDVLTGYAVGLLGAWCAAWGLRARLERRKSL